MSKEQGAKIKDISYPIDIQHNLLTTGNRQLITDKSKSLFLAPLFREHKRYHNTCGKNEQNDEQGMHGGKTP